MSVVEGLRPSVSRNSCTGDGGGSGGEEMLLCAFSIVFLMDLRTVTFKQSYHCTAELNARQNGSLMGSSWVFMSAWERLRCTYTELTFLLLTEYPLRIYSLLRAADMAVTASPVCSKSAW